MENIRNQDGIGPQELLVMSFGTSFQDTRIKTIGAIEEAMEHAFPQWSVRRGFTSDMILRAVAKRDGIEMDSVEQSLSRAARNSVRTLVVQPTHLMDGLEFHDVREATAAEAGKFEKIVLGRPVLDTTRDFLEIAKIITADTAQWDDGHTAICFMGHGSEAEANRVYAQLQVLLRELGYAHYYIGTVEAKPDLDHLLELVEAGSYKRVVLQPLMIVAGDHATNDMASDEEDSWKTVFTQRGYEVTCILKGLGEIPAIQQMLVRHAQEAMDALNM